MIAPVALILDGTARARGRAQAALEPASSPAVRDLVADRLHGAAALLAQTYVQRFLAAQWDFAGTHDAEGLAEMIGIAEGHGLSPHDLFAFLHAGQLSGLPDDGCTAWAYAHPEHGALLVKNRDLRGPALSLQRVFHHSDPAWGAREVLCVGSLGAPGAYSSGINSDGFALVDTQVVTTDQGVGLLRYFLMTRLLVRCATVAEAVEQIHATRHAGGGTLVLADATGAIATVELGHRTVAIDHPTAPWTARTNHFLSPGLSDRLAARPSDPGIDVSHARLAELSAWLANRIVCPTNEEARVVMSSHDSPGTTGLCRHGGDSNSSTVSCAIFACAPRSLYFAHGNPCTADWGLYGIGAPHAVRDRTGR